MSIYVNILDIINISGIDKYMLIKNTGSVIAHNLNNPVEMSSVLKTAGSECSRFEAPDHFGELKYFTLNISEDKTLMVFEINDCFLGVISEPGITESIIIREIVKFIKTIS